jgi:hypothetical protein
MNLGLLIRHFFVGIYRYEFFRQIVLKIPNISVMTTAITFYPFYKLIPVVASEGHGLPEKGQYARRALAFS